MPAMEQVTARPVKRRREQPLLSFGRSVATSGSEWSFIHSLTLVPTLSTETAVRWR
jgi:hypothetical protein